MRLAKAEDLIKMGFKVEDLEAYGKELIDFAKGKAKSEEKPVEEGNEDKGKKKKGGK